MTDRDRQLDIDPPDFSEESTDSLVLVLARARLALVSGDLLDAARRLRRLRAVTGTDAYWSATLMLGETYRERGDLAAAVRMFREVERGVEKADPSETALNLGLAWQSIGHPGCAHKVYANLVSDFPFHRLESVDDGRIRIAAVAAYRLGCLTVEENLDEAWTWWQRALDLGVAEVAPAAGLALAMRIGSGRLYSARIEELFRQVVDFDHPHASPQAALELGRLFAGRLQASQAEEYFGYAIESEHPEFAPPAREELDRLARSRGGSQGSDSEELAASLRRALDISKHQTAVMRASLAREKRRRVLLVGAGTGGQYLLESLRKFDRPYEVCGILDDEATKVPKHLRASVLGRLSELPEVLARERPHEVFMAIPTAPGTVRAAVVHACSEARVPLRNLPTMHELHHDRDLYAQLRSVQIEETYGVNPVLVDRGALVGLPDRSALLIGGAGAIGSAIARRMASGQVKHLMLFDRNEASLERLTHELTVERSFSRVFPVLGDAYDEAALDHAFDLRRPSQVFFAAGSAHPQLFEENIVSAARNEVLGAADLARRVAEHAVETLLFVSSTYAARPETPFGAAKALAELAVLAACQDSPTSCTTLRVGSLFRSPGSPVEWFERQIELGGPVTVPDAELSRKFLTGTRAAELCLRAARIARPGERLAVDAGEALNLREMAAKMVRLSGGMLGIDTQVDHTPALTYWAGSDEFVGEDESATPTSHTDLVALQGRRPDAEDVREALARLRDVVEGRDPLSVRRTLLELAEWLTGPDGGSGAHALPAGPNPESNLVGLDGC